MSNEVVKQKIPIADLAVGMLVTGVDRPWYATPFLSHRFVITKDSEIETLKSCGVKIVEIERDKSASTGAPVASPPSPAKLVNSAPKAGPPAQVAPVETKPLSAGGTDPAPTSQGMAKSDRPTATGSGDGPQVPFEEELHEAKASYHQARAAVQAALAQAKMGRAFELEAVGSAVGSLAESILRNPHALASLSRLKAHDEYTYYHSVNTCVLAMALGRSLHMGRETLQKLGLGMLLHDVGKAQISEELLTKPGRLQDQESEVIKQHVMRGADYLTETMHLDAESLLPVLEHHERMDGSGYPHHLRRPDLSEFGLISGVVDVYDALTSDRPYRKAVSPHQALQMLYDLSRRGQLESGCVERFIRCMGIYPVGSCVQLSSGAIGIVSRINAAQTLNPVVLIVKESPGSPVGAPRECDLSLQSSKPTVRITEVLSPASIGIAPNDVLNGVQFGTTLSQAA